jgi:hypothetical protein
MDRQAEVNRLGQAERRIANAERIVTEQRLRVDRLRADGHDTKGSEQTLRGFEDTLKILRENRAVIVEAIEQIDKGLA